jgi:hypothetical protein
MVTEHDRLVLLQAMKCDRPTRDEVFAKAIATLNKRMRLSYFSCTELREVICTEQHLSEHSYLGRISMSEVRVSFS